MTTSPSDEPEPEITGLYETPDGHVGFLHHEVSFGEITEAQDAQVIDLTEEEE